VINRIPYETSQEMLGADATPEIEPSLGGEDFGRFLLEYPGSYFRLGTALSREEPRWLHTSHFDIDEAALPVGAELMAQIAVNALYRLKEE
jgi:metal-dependent amidase/aminoacylase/carboxypeptidase family protein